MHKFTSNTQDHYLSILAAPELVQCCERSSFDGDSNEQMSIPGDDMISGRLKSIQGAPTLLFRRFRGQLVCPDGAWVQALGGNGRGHVMRKSSGPLP